MSDHLKSVTLAKTLCFCMCVCGSTNNKHEPSGETRGTVYPPTLRSHYGYTKNLELQRFSLLIQQQAHNIDMNTVVQHLPRGMGYSTRKEC